MSEPNLILKKVEKRRKLINLLINVSHAMLFRTVDVTKLKNGFFDDR